LQTALSLAPNALNFFQGGITAYNLGQKARHFEVDPIFAEACDCVSENVASSMAKSVHRLFSCDWGLATTGYASPVPEKNIKRLYMCFAISNHNKIVLAQTIYCKPQTPFDVGVYYTHAILKEFVNLLRRKK
jgi:nicotinamide-nucleotide amidase